MSFAIISRVVKRLGGMGRSFVEERTILLPAISDSSLKLRQRMVFSSPSDESDARRQTLNALFASSERYRMQGPPMLRRYGRSATSSDMLHVQAFMPVATGFSMRKS
jgi:hypothetical protein